jgi:hypothetical protein
MLAKVRFLICSVGCLAALFGGQVPAAQALVSPVTVIDGPSPELRDIGGVSMAADGTGGMVFRKTVNGRAHIFVSQFRDGNWSPAQRVDTGPTQNYESSWPAIGAGDDGRLVVVWVQEFGANDRMYSAALQPGSQQFEDPVPVDLAAGDSSQGIYPQVSMSAGGLAFVIYRVVTDPIAATAPPGNVYGEYRAARFGGQYWSGIGSVLNRNPASAMPVPTSYNRPRIGIDQTGNAVAAWQELDDNFVPRIYARRIFSAGVGIARQVTPAKIDGKSITGAADQFDLSVGVNSEAAVAWRQNPSTRSGFKRKRIFVALSGDMYSPQAATFGTATAVDGGGTDGPAAAVNGVSVSVAGPTARVTFGLTGGTTQTVTAYDGASDEVETLDDTASLTQPSRPFGLLAASGASAWLWRRATAERDGVTVVERTAAGDNAVRSLYTASGGAVDGVSFAGSGLGDALIAFAQGSGARRRIAAAYVDAPPGAVNVQTPMGFVTTQTLQLAWDVSPHAIGGVTYSIEIDGETVASGITKTVWNLPLTGLASGTHSVDVVSVDSAGQTASGPAGTFALDRLPPTAAVAVSGRTVMVKVSDAPRARAAGVDAAKTSVTFGDGSRKSGNPNASHVYSRAGTYQVAVKAFDVLGNSATTSKTVTVR